MQPTKGVVGRTRRFGRLRKGILHRLVVMMRWTLGVGKPSARKARCAPWSTLPGRSGCGFFLIGLFLAQVIDRDWRTYLNARWCISSIFTCCGPTIQFAFKAPLFTMDVASWARMALH